MARRVLRPTRSIWLIRKYLFLPVKTVSRQWQKELSLFILELFIDINYRSLYCHKVGKKSGLI